MRKFILTCLMTMMVQTGCATTTPSNPEFQALTAQLQDTQRAHLAKLGPDAQEFIVKFAKLRNPLFPGMSPTVDVAAMYALQREGMACIEQVEANMTYAVIKDYVGLTGEQIKNKVFDAVFSCMASKGWRASK
jgi:hypothetical protein